MKIMPLALFLALAPAAARADTYCEKKPPASATDEEQERFTLTRDAGCGDRGFDPYWFDIPELTDLERVSFLASCLNDRKPDNPETLGNVAMWCSDDLAQLDNAHLKKLITSLKLPRLEEAFEHLAEWRTALASLRDDKNWRRILDAQAKATAAWYAATKAHADDLKEAAGYVRAAEVEPDTAKGCSTKVHAMMKEHLATRKPKNLDEVRAALEDPVGYPLYVALGSCIAVDKLGAQAIPLYYRPAPDGAMSSGYDFYVDPVRGPRMAGLNAATAELVKVLESSPKFPLKKLTTAQLPPREKQLPSKFKALADVHAFQRGEGTIASLKPDKHGRVTIAFKTEIVTRDIEDCKDTKKIHRINPDGTIEYWQDCRVTGTERDKVTPRTIKVAKQFTDGLKVGRYVTYFWVGSDFDEGVMPGVIYAIWTDKKRKAMAGWGGFAW